MHYYQGVLCENFRLKHKLIKCFLYSFIIIFFFVFDQNAFLLIFSIKHPLIYPSTYILPLLHCYRITCHRNSCCMPPSHGGGTLLNLRSQVGMLPNNSKTLYGCCQWIKMNSHKKLQSVQRQTSLLRSTFGIWWLFFCFLSVTDKKIVYGMLVHSLTILKTRLNIFKGNISM